MSPARASDALRLLIEGNERFVRGESTLRVEPAADREAFTLGQMPKAIVFGCADSRVPPELLFDMGRGELFVIRDAGHVIDRGSIASAEFAVTALGTRLMVVLAHQGCGAIQAAVSDSRAAPYLDVLIEAIRPVCDGDTSDHDEIARRHARRTAARLTEESEILARAVADGDLLIKSAFCYVCDGRVEFD